jgi:hypothetical protein
MRTQRNVDALFLTESEAASLLRVSRRTLQRLRHRADGPPFNRLGDRRLVYPTRHLLAWADGRRIDLISQEPVSRAASCEVGQASPRAIGLERNTTVPKSRHITKRRTEAGRMVLPRADALPPITRPRRRNTR